jgi:hypothetical protein
MHFARQGDLEGVDTLIGIGNPAEQGGVAVSDLSNGEVCDGKAPAVDRSTRALWLALMILFSLIVGAAAGLLVWAGGDNPFVAVLTGGGAFGATLLLLLAIFHFATTDSKVGQ